MRRPMLIASILALLVACDKPQPEVPAAPPVPLTPISATSTILFSVFGAQDDPRIVPIAIADGGRLSALTLDADGWQRLDSLFLRRGSRLPIYRNGSDAGTVEVTRGMWTDEGSLYSLPGCQLLVPQGQGKLHASGNVEIVVEYLASTTPLKQSTDASPLPRDATAQARTLAGTVAAAKEVGAEELQGLDFISRWLRTGAGGKNGRTVMASYIDPNAGDAGAGAGHSVMLLALAEDSAGSLVSSYQHVSTGEARAVVMQRVVNHADLDGDGIDEIVLEEWKYAGSPEFVMLKYAQGKWRAVSRVSQNWCLDVKPPA